MRRLKIVRRTATIAVVLLVGTTATALILATIYHLGVAAILVTILGGLPGLYLTWAAFHADRLEANDVSLGKLADELAIAIGMQWEAEAAMWRLNDPFPLAISWKAATPNLTDDWDDLVRLALTGAGWPAPKPDITWASSPTELAGEGADLATTMAVVPTGRLVVLGPPGAGKTMLMVRLVMDLLKDRMTEGPVPVLLQLSSWNPEDQNLNAWIADQLALEHSALGGSTSTGNTRANALLAARLIIPILDGLDEIPDALRGAAISKINDALPPGQPVLVTCRTREYQEAVRPADGLEVTLRGAAAIQIDPLDPPTIARYLQADAGGPIAKTRWNPVISILGSNAPIAQAMTTPLMVSLARLIYNPRPDERVGELRDPAELCGSTMTSCSVVEEHLFDAFIRAAYRRQDKETRWTAARAETYLMFIARLLEYDFKSPNLAWWELRNDRRFGVSKISVTLVMTAALTLTCALIGFPLPWICCLGMGPLIGGILATLVKPTLRPARSARFSIRKFFGSFIPMFSLLLVASVLALSLIEPNGQPITALQNLLATIVTIAFALGFMFALLWGITGGLRNVQDDLWTGATPQSVLSRDRRIASVIAATALIGSVAVFSILLLPYGSTDGYNATLLVASFIGLSFALMSTPLLCFTRTAWPTYKLACASFALRGQLPWNLTTFLSDAHRRGVLRRAGAFYQFRHLELQHRLASGYVSSDSTDLAAAHTHKLHVLQSRRRTPTSSEPSRPQPSGPPRARSSDD
jgi:hypothetical protein